MEIYAVAGSVASVIALAVAVMQLWLSTRRQPNFESLARRVQVARARELQVLLRDPRAYVDLRMHVNLEVEGAEWYPKSVEPTALTSDLPMILTRARGTIVIEGASGAGKSLMLRNATAVLMSAPSCDRIYDFFSARGWHSSRRQKLETWIAEQVRNRWQVREEYVVSLIRTGQLVPIIEDLDHLESEQAAELVRQIDELAVTCKGIVVALRADSEDGAWARLSRQVVLTVQPLNATEQKMLIGSIAANQAAWEALRRADGKRGGSLEWAFTSPLWLALALRAVAEPADLGRVGDPQTVKHLLLTGWMISALNRGASLGVAGTPKRGIRLTWRWMSTMALMAQRYPAQEFSPMIADLAAIERASSMTALVAGVGPLLGAVSAGYSYFASWELALLIGGATYAGQFFVSSVSVERYYKAKTARLEASFLGLEIAAGLAVLTISASLILSRGSDVNNAMSFGLFMAATSCWKRWIGTFFARGWIRRGAFLPSRLRRFLRWCADPEIQLMVAVNGAYRFAHADLLSTLAAHPTPLETIEDR